MNMIASKLDFPAVLDDLWQQHTTPRCADAPTVISTFAGTGGSSLGYSAAGFHELLAVEWDGHAVECFRSNFPDVDVYHGDISALTVDEVLSRTGLAVGQLDVFDGSPPCQGFSTAGKRQIGDSRNQLFREYVRLLHGLQPKVFLMENVSGMVKGNMKLIFAEVMQALKGCGYRVSARLLNAQYFGVPQSRERMIFIGVRDDLGIDPSHPAPLPMRPITVRQAWAELPDERGDALRGPALAVAAYVQPGTGNGGGRVSKWVRGTTAGFGLTRLSWNKPSPTIPKLSVLTSSPLVHPDRNERLTLAQVRRLCSFPDLWKMEGSYNDQHARYGNAVMPLFARSLALHIRTSILDRIKGVLNG